jgi:ribose-phosphate pyrophosphokinase
MREVVVFSGSAHEPLAHRICDELGVELSQTALSRFSNDCLQAQLLANCRQRDVYIVQPLVPPTQGLAHGAAAHDRWPPRAPPRA